MTLKSKTNLIFDKFLCQICHQDVHVLNFEQINIYLTYKGNKKGINNYAVCLGSRKMFCLVMDIDFFLDYNLLVEVDGYQARTNRIYIHPDQQQLDIFCQRYSPGFHDEEKFTVKSSSRFFNIILNAFNNDEDVIDINFQTSNRIIF